MRVTTYQHAYDSRRRASLCRRHDHDDTAFGSRGPVEHSLHQGTCDECWRLREEARNREYREYRESAEL